MVSLNFYDILTNSEIQRSPVYHFICFLTLLFVFFRSGSGLSSLCLSVFFHSGSGLLSLLLSICSLPHGLLGSTIFLFLSIFFFAFWKWPCSFLLSICSLPQGLLGSTIFFVRLWGGEFCCVYVCIPSSFRKQAHGTYSEDFHAAQMPTPAEPDESMSRRVLWGNVALLKPGTLMLWNKSQRAPSCESSTGVKSSHGIRISPGRFHPIFDNISTDFNEFPSHKFFNFSYNNLFVHILTKHNVGKDMYDRTWELKLRLSLLGWTSNDWTYNA